MKPADTEAGFSLIEALVAVAVIAAMTGLLFSAIGARAQAAERLARRREAVMLAQSALATALADAGLAESGRWSGLSWRTVRRPDPERRDGGAPLDRITVRVVDDASGQRLAQVDTLALGH